MTNRKVLGIIPARAGSKTVKHKNVKDLGGKPLIAWTIEVAMNSDVLDRVIVSTDDPLVVEICEQMGCEYQLRPEELATDTAPTLPVLQHVVSELEKDGYKADLIMLLQCTTPFRTEKHIRECIAVFDTHSADSVMSVSAVPKHFSPLWQKSLDENGLLVPAVEDGSIKDDKKYTRKQELPTTYWKNGMLYLMPYETLIDKDSLFGNSCAAYICNDEYPVNIDDYFDFLMAELVLKEVLKQN